MSIYIQHDRFYSNGDKKITIQSFHKNTIPLNNLSQLDKLEHLTIKNDNTHELCQEAQYEGELKLPPNLLSLELYIDNLLNPTIIFNNKLEKLTIYEQHNTHIDYLNDRCAECNKNKPDFKDKLINIFLSNHNYMLQTYPLSLKSINLYYNWKPYQLEEFEFLTLLKNKITPHLPYGCSLSIEKIKDYKIIH